MTDAITLTPGATLAAQGGALYLIQDGADGRVITIIHLDSINRVSIDYGANLLTIEYCRYHRKQEFSLKFRPQDADVIAKATDTCLSLGSRQADGN